MNRPIPLQKDAADALAALEKACFSVPWSREGLVHTLENDFCRVLGLYRAGVLAAYGVLQTIDSEGEILRLAVLPPFRRQGLGEELLTALLAEKGLSAVFLEVRAGNGPALALYEKAGFAPVGRRPRYYQNPEEDALLLRLSFEKGEIHADSCD